VTGMLSDFRQIAAQRWESFAGAGRSPLKF